MGDMHSTWRELLEVLDAHTPDEAAALVSLVCLSIVTVGMAVVMFSMRFNMLQALSSGLIAIWSMSRIAFKIEFPHTTPEHLLLHVGLATYVAATAWKIWAQGRHQRRQDEP